MRHFHLVEALKTNDADAVIVALTQLLLAAAKPSPSLVNSKITMPLLPSYGTPLHLAVALSSRPVVEKILSVFCGLGSGAGGSGAGGSGAAGSGAVRAAAVSVGSTNAPRSAPSSNTSSSNTIPSSTPSSSSSSSPQNYHTLGLAWVNAKNNAHGSGETPLHIASRLGRAEIVDLMLRVPSIDDTLRDAEGRVAEEVTKSEKVSELFLGKAAESSSLGIF